MSTATWLQCAGTSMSRASKTNEPFGLRISLWRFWNGIAAYGESPLLVNRRWIFTSCLLLDFGADRPGNALACRKAARRAAPPASARAAGRRRGGTGAASMRDHHLRRAAAHRGPSSRFRHSVVAVQLRGRTDRSAPGPRWRPSYRSAAAWAAGVRRGQIHRGGPLSIELGVG